MCVWMHMLKHITFLRIWYFLTKCHISYLHFISRITILFYVKSFSSGEEKKKKLIKPQ